MQTSDFQQKHNSIITINHTITACSLLNDIDIVNLPREKLLLCVNDLITHGTFTDDSIYNEVIVKYDSFKMTKHAFNVNVNDMENEVFLGDAQGIYDNMIQCLKYIAAGSKIPKENWEKFDELEFECYHENENLKENPNNEAGHESGVKIIKFVLRNVQSICLYGRK